MSLRRLGVGVTVAVMALVACGKAVEKAAPGLTVRSAAQSTFDGERGRFTLSLVGDEADMATLFELTEADEDRKFLDVLRNSRLEVSIDNGDDKESPDDDSFAFQVDLGGHPVEIRMVDKVLYARADVNGLVELFDADPAALSQWVADAGGTGFGFLGDAVAGRWLAVDFAPLEQMMGGFAGGDSPSDAEGFSEFLAVISDTFGSDVAVERLGEEDAGEHHRLTVPVRRVYERLVPALSALVPFPGATPPPAAGIPDRSVALDLWISDDRIRRAELDLGQFGDQVLPGRVALRVDIAGLDGAIEAPADAVPVDVMQLLGQLMAGFGAGFGSGPNGITG